MHSYGPHNQFINHSIFAKNSRGKANAEEKILREII